jgi:phosphate transport system permease protein
MNTATMTAQAAALQASRVSKHAKRKRVNAIALTLSLAAMAFGLFWLIWILVETVRLGLGGLTLSLFTQMTPPPQSEDGGLANAIFGSVTMVTLATLIGTPVGILAGIYLAEYGQKTWLGSVTRSSTTSCWRRLPSLLACSSIR